MFEERECRECPYLLGEWGRIGICKKIFSEKYLPLVLDVKCTLADQDDFETFSYPDKDQRIPEGLKRRMALETNLEGLKPEEKDEQIQLAQRLNLSGCPQATIGGIGRLTLIQNLFLRSKRPSNLKVLETGDQHIYIDPSLL